MSIRGFACRLVPALIALCLTATGVRVARAQAAQAPGAGAAGAISADAEEKARAHFRLGRAHYDNGDFAQAAVEFESAYRISQRAALLYNIYLAYRDASDTRHAAEALRKYLQLEQKVENRGQLESRLAALDRSLADGTAPAPTQTAAAPLQPAAATPSQPSSLQPSAAATAPATEAVAPVQATASTELDTAPSRPLPILPIVLMGTGGAMMAGSIITGVMTLGKKSDLSDAQAECTKLGNCQSLTTERVAELKAAQNSGKTLALVTDILLFGGLAVAGTGAVLFFLRPGSQERAPAATSAALACAPGACMGTLRTQF
jgi:tetratricopeptide (TPR) repeat protein